MHSESKDGSMAEVNQRSNSASMASSEGEVSADKGVNEPPFP